MEQLSGITAWVEVPASWGNPPRRYVFGEPLEVWEAASLDQVRPALERVAEAQRDGLYVAGFLTYEAAPAFDRAMKTPPAGELPYTWFASFESQTPFPPLPPSDGGRIKDAGPTPVSSFKFQVSDEDYVSAVHRALAHIRAGDIYQVNYTVRAELEIADPWALFQTLFAAAPMPHAAYLDTGAAQIVSLSPELFLRKRGKILESRPMKGTARREPSWMADEAARRALSRDEKNRAENVMIVDLVRNDLGRICQMGTVTVPELWRVDRFPTVHQMTSLVRGELRDGVSLFDIFAALFPPGSVTGAPKIRAMEIISELEPTPRGIYCGTVGLFFPNGDFECNVAIRTLQQADKLTGRQADKKHVAVTPSASQLVSSSASPLFVLGLGSGIVADSDPEEEWQETLLKGEFVTQTRRDFILYETIRYDQRIKDKGERIKPDHSTFLLSPFSFLDLRSHLRRLRQSCMYFGRPFPRHEIIEHLRTLKIELGDRPARVKLDLHFGDIETQVIRENLSWPEGGMTVMLSDLCLDPGDFRLYHKANLRPEKYEELEKARALGATEVLFLNTRGEICEGALSNIALKIDGQCLTPALHCGLLPGTWRDKQIASGRLQEAVLTLDDLRRADEIRMGNAVRGDGKVIRIMNSKGGTV